MTPIFWKNALVAVVPREATVIDLVPLIHTPVVMFHAMFMMMMLMEVVTVMMVVAVMVVFLVMSVRTVTRMFCLMLGHDDLSDWSFANRRAVLCSRRVEPFEGGRDLC